MGVDAGLTLRVGIERGQVAILDAFLESQWSGEPEGWTVVPLGEDLGERSTVATVEELTKLFHAKLRADEDFGVTLFWADTEIGGQLLVCTDQQVVFSPTINRVTLGERTTDVSWYLERILPVLARPGGITIESWVWTETA